MNLPELGALLADNRAKKFDPAQVVFAIQGERSCRCGRRADDPRTCGRAREAEQGGSESGDRGCLRRGAAGASVSK